ncbi:MAG: hypothetical protein FWF95_06010, partial [Syntrophorhabdaceae bacterium]|nr:hypothetical protein [Syntrophorhabdaceae bacterium]
DLAVSAWKRNTTPSMKNKRKEGSLMADDGSQDTPTPNDGTPTYSESRAIREMLNLRLAKLKYDELAGLLIKVEHAATVIEADYSRVRARLLAIPPECAESVAMSNDVSKCRSILQAVVTDALEELSSVDLKK